MLTAITSLVIIFLTSFLANWLIHNWQYRNWLNQQRFLGFQKEYEHLLTLFNEISTLAGKRLARAHRLTWSLFDAPIPIITSRLSEYDHAVTEWNEALNSLLVRLTMYGNYGMTQRLERDIHNNFVSAHGALTALARNRISGIPASTANAFQALDRLNALQGLLFAFNRDMLKFVEEMRTKTFQGIVVPFSRENLHLFSTWHLFKALFVRSKESLSIVRPASDLRSPHVGGD